MSAARDTLLIYKLQLESTDNLDINVPNRIEIGHFVNQIDRLIWFEIKSRPRDWTISDISVWSRVDPSSRAIGSQHCLCQFNRSENSIHLFPVIGEAKKNEVKWEVERIISTQKYIRKIEYLVKWLGYREHKASWIRENDLEHAQGSIADWRIKNPAKYKKLHRSTSITKLKIPTHFTFWNQSTNSRCWLWYHSASYFVNGCS